MHTVDFVDGDKYKNRVGDLCRKLYIPLVIPGRYASNVEDIENILHAWLQMKYKKEKKRNEEKKKKKKQKKSGEITGSKKIKREQIVKYIISQEKKQGKIVEEEKKKEMEYENIKKKEKDKKNTNKKKRKFKDLYMFSILFKESFFSLVLAKSKYENSFCAWQTFWCAWIDVFKTSMKQDNTYEQKYKKKIIEFQAGCIYLLFLLYFSQYVKLNHYTYPIYMTPDTVNLCLDVTEKCENLNKFIELRFILNFMFDTNSIILSCNERISETFQDRYGFPLYLERAKMIDENSLEINDIHLEKLYNVLMNKMENINKLCDEQRSKNAKNKSGTYNFKLQLEHIKKILTDI